MKLSNSITEGQMSCYRDTLKSVVTGQKVREVRFRESSADQYFNGFDMVLDNGLVVEFYGSLEGKVIWNIEKENRHEDI